MARREIVDCDGCSESDLKDRAVKVDVTTAIGDVHLDLCPACAKKAIEGFAAFDPLQGMSNTITSKDESNGRVVASLKPGASPKRVRRTKAQIAADQANGSPVPVLVPTGQPEEEDLPLDNF